MLSILRIMRSRGKILTLKRLRCSMGGKNVVAKEDSAFCHYEVFHLLRSRYKNIYEIDKLMIPHALNRFLRRQSVICCSAKQSLAGLEIAAFVVRHAWAVVHKAGKLECLPQIIENEARRAARSASARSACRRASGGWAVVDQCAIRGMVERA